MIFLSIRVAYHTRGARNIKEASVDFLVPNRPGQFSMTHGPFYLAKEITRCQLPSSR